MLGVSYHKQTRMYDNRSIFTLYVKTSQLSLFGHVCRLEMPLKIMIQETVDSSQRREDSISFGMTTSRNGQASHCRQCCASQTTEVDDQPSQQRGLSDSNDARASRELAI